jgi:iron complex outermembrane receptor protein
LKWEETTTYNIGLDYGILNDRIYGSIDAYYRETTDLLNVVPVPAGTNFTNRILSNVGTLEVKGLELSIAGRLISTRNLYWEVGFNASHNVNEITKLTTVTDPDYVGVETGGISGGTGNSIQIHSVGFARNSFYVYEQVYDENGNPIEGLYVDRNDDGIINASDKYRYKDPAPDYTLGFSSRFEYRNWDASFSARAKIGNYVYNNVVSDNAYFSDLLYSQYTRNALTSITETSFYNPQYNSDYYIENASFLRMDNITVGYTFNQISNLLEGAKSARISATVQNAFVITEYSGLDPEVFGGIDNNIYPRPRTFVLGLSLNF